MASRVKPLAPKYRVRSIWVARRARLVAARFRGQVKGAKNEGAARREKQQKLSRKPDKYRQRRMNVAPFTQPDERLGRRGEEKAKQDGKDHVPCSADAHADDSHGSEKKQRVSAACSSPFLLREKRSAGGTDFVIHGPMLRLRPVIVTRRGTCTHAPAQRRKARPHERLT